MPRLPCLTTAGRWRWSRYGATSRGLPMACECRRRVAGQQPQRGPGCSWESVAGVLGLGVWGGLLGAVFWSCLF